jgi:tripartite-type tricarboxylate transporter receptor subunit TctC
MNARSAFLAVLATLGAAVPAAAQQYPTRPITLVIPLPPGGSNDIMARVASFDV